MTMPDLDPLFLALWAAAPLSLAAERALRQPRARPWPELGFFVAGAGLWLAHRGWSATGVVTAVVALCAAASVVVPLTALRPRLTRPLAALVATLPPALLGSVAVAVHAPLARDTRLALGMLLPLPLWVGAMCLVFLVRGPARAWLLCAVVAALLSLLVPGT